MRFERLTDCHDPRYEAARALYGKSFPRHEQREAASQAAILAHPAYRFNLIYDGDEFVGLLLCWETDDFIYVEHFCIEPDKRGRRYGSRALELLGAEGKTVILEIDPPVDEISIRRRGFYERALPCQSPCARSPGLSRELRGTCAGDHVRARAHRPGAVRRV